MVSQLLGAGVGLDPIGHVPLVDLSLVPRAHSPNLVLCFIHALLAELFLDQRAHSRSPRISHTAALKAVPSLARSVSYQTANV